MALSLSKTTQELIKLIKEFAKHIPKELRISSSVSWISGIFLLIALMVVKLPDWQKFILIIAIILCMLTPVVFGIYYQKRNLVAPTSAAFSDAEKKKYLLRMIRVESGLYTNYPARNISSAIRVSQQDLLDFLNKLLSM